MFGGKLLFLGIACVSGILMAVQGTANALLGKITGLLEATFIVHVTGLILVTILLFARLGHGNVFSFTKAPWYSLIGGVIGVAIIYAVAKSIPQVGVAPATTAIIVGQVLTATLIDHFGLFGMQRLPLGWSKLIGTSLLAAGAWFLLKR